MAGNEEITEAKVSQLHCVGLVEEDDVFRLQVTVDNMQLMTVRYGTHNLNHKKTHQATDLLELPNINEIYPRHPRKEASLYYCCSCWYTE